MARLTRTPNRKPKAAINGMSWNTTRLFWLNSPFKTPEALKTAACLNLPSFDFDAYAKHCRGGDKECNEISIREST